MRDSRSVANRFLDLALERGDAVTPMQLLKLVYIAHGWMLGLHGRPLIRDEVEAWQYGPVIPRLYNAIRRFRSQPVEGPLSAENAALDATEDSIVRQVYDIYGNRSGPALSRLTHQKGSPWDAVYDHGSYGTVIPNDLIEDHYARLAKKAAA
ncbi:DUF4065 domain-containing protein [Sphingomonas suaedae]|uniref:DUF4065 domain-containing protein n=1 Tax=Sphingomonas suaedae TaxID=2599297 RepID=A0A518RIG9_9SPHN|nr:type II toxin-antitoxin system antitoxin SocA domain-containing protein [Sphingomonas suaedae]QDX27224.1 DUF4065 domain-containing protein [Sphingomonas suaedae]